MRVEKRLSSCQANGRGEGEERRGGRRGEGEIWMGFFFKSLFLKEYFTRNKTMLIHCTHNPGHGAELHEFIWYSQIIITTITYI